MRAAGVGHRPAEGHSLARFQRAVTAVRHAQRQHVQASRGPHLAPVADGSDQQQQQQALFSHLLPRQAVAMFAAGAALGPFCDGLHSQHDVLHYVHPTVSLHLDSLQWSFETCWWVPLLFGVAGLILGMSVPLLDELAAAQRVDAPAAAAAAAGGARMGAQEGSWPWVLLCISLFVVCYWLSAVLEQPLLGETWGPVPALDALLCAYALLHWYVFDRTLQGFGMAVLTAACGPAVEVGLVRLFGLYQYAHPVWAGAVPTWIPWVYFCGGPAVGNLGRLVWRTLKQRQLQRS